MSKWIDSFSSHQFQQFWSDIITNIDDCELDDVTVSTSVEELSRLKKVVNYIDGIINGLDPELTPLSVFDQFAPQAQQCLNQINSFLNNRNIGHITNANKHADNLLTYIRPYMLYPGSMRKPLQAAVREYSKTYQETITNFTELSEENSNIIKEFRDDTEREFEKIKSYAERIIAYIDKVFSDNDPENSIEFKLDEILKAYQEKMNDINSLHDELLIGDTTSDEKPTLSLINDAKKQILGDVESISKKLSTVESEIVSLNKFYEKVYGKENEKGEVKGGIDSEIKTKLKLINDFDTTQKNKYKELLKEIEGLLPGATTAGLAKAYQDMKESFNTPIKLWNGVFIILILTLLGISYDSLISHNPKNWEEVIFSFLNRLPFYIPLVWFAIYASKRRSENQRLEQEYAHKEALAKSYNSYKKQILELGETDQKMLLKLIDSAIDTISYNSSKTLDGKHGDKTPLEEILKTSKNPIQEIVKGLKGSVNES